MQQTLGLSIEGMHCGGCIRRVTNVLERVDGVQVDSVEVGSAKVTFRPEQTSAVEIATALDRIGFAARIEE